jgi:hypothetical protein
MWLTVEYIFMSSENNKNWLYLYNLLMSFMNTKNKKM